MRIVDRKAFLALPEGTVFQKYSPQVVSDFGIKGETWGNDFIILPLDVGFLVGAGSDTELCDLYYRMEEEGDDIGIDFETTQRDGCFDEDQLFAVWSDSDVRGLIDVLSRALVQPYHAIAE